MNGSLTLDDILKLPEQIRPEHLQALGLLAPPAQPAPMIPPATVSAKISPVMNAAPRPAGSVAPMMKPVMPERAALPPLATPEIPTTAAMAAPPVNPSAGPPNLNFKEREALPLTSPGVQAGSSGYWQGVLQKTSDEKANPWGSAENHPGTIGKIGHIAARIGNIAGNIVAPATMANIPGTDLNKKAEEEYAQGELAEAQGRETAAKHEKNVEETNEEKLKEAQQKIDETERQHLSQREIALRKQGLKPNPDDPNGTPVALAYEDMSPNEQAVHDLKVAQADSQTAKAALDKIKADPNSPQSQAALARIRVMAQNAATAAGKLGLDKVKFKADYFGLDENDNPIPGVQTTEEGKPVGPKIARTTQGTLKDFNTHYIVPAEGVEKSYQMMDNAYKDYKAAKDRGEELPTGAESMLALSTHLTTTFGNVKGARITKDMIEHHLGARSVPDSALVAFQRLTNGDVLSPDQWEAFHKLIGESRKLSWKTAVKEGKRADLPIDFLPEDLQGELSKGGAKPDVKGKPVQEFKAPEGAPPAKDVPDGKVLKDASGKVVARAKGGQWQAP